MPAAALQIHHSRPLVINAGLITSPITKSKAQTAVPTTTGAISLYTGSWLPLSLPSLTFVRLLRDLTGAGWPAGE
jgi:hypothetical protein